MQFYRESAGRLADARKTDSQRRHLFMMQNRDAIIFEDQPIPLSVAERDEEMTRSAEMIERLEAAVGRWSPLLAELFQLAVKDRLNLLTPAFNATRSLRRMPHEIDSFDWTEFQPELLSLRDEASRRIAHPVDTKPEVILGEHPQVTIDGVAIAITFEQAEYLKALIERGDWLSSAEFRTGSRPDRICKDLPSPISDRIETHPSRGKRWRLT